MIVRRLAIAAAGAALLGLVAVAPWHLFNRSDPRRFLEDAHDRLRAASSPRLPDVQRREAFRRWIAETVDLETAAAEVVGTAWETTPPERRRDAQARLGDFLADRYALAASRIAVTSLEIIAIDEDWPVGRRARARATSPGRAPIEIEIRLRETATGWRIADIVLEGISVLRQTVREIGTPRPAARATAGPP